MPGRWEIPGEPLFTDEKGQPTTRTSRCLKQLVDTRSAEFIRLYRHYQNGHLLNAGGVADQPAIYLEVMQLIEGRLNSG